MVIQLKKKEIKHPIYVMRDDFLINYQSILGNDFIKKHNAKHDYKAGKLSLEKEALRPYKNIELRLRSETIVEAIADSNQIGIVQGEETQPGVFIGSCLVQPNKNLCLVSINNTTEKTVTIRMPLVNIEALEEESESENEVESVSIEAEAFTRRKKVRKALRVNYKALERRNKTFI